MASNSEAKAHIHNLSILAMSPARSREALDYVAALSADGRAHLLALADANHVVLRALRPLKEAAIAAGAIEVAQFASEALDKEEARIANALKFWTRYFGSWSQLAAPLQ